MECLHIILSKHPGNYKDIMIWDVCCFAYFGLLRISEFTTLSPNCLTLLLTCFIICSFRQSYIPYKHTNYSKNDQFRTGITIFLGKTTHKVCPVDALVQYLAIQGGTPGPLFLVPNYQSLTSQSIVQFSPQKMLTGVTHGPLPV